MRRFTEWLPLTASLAFALWLGWWPIKSDPPHTLHVTFVDVEAPIDVRGTLDGNTYALSLNRAMGPPNVANYKPLSKDDAGRDFKAFYDPDHDQVVIDVPNKGRAYYYPVRFVD
jgi:hypothetical protein